MVKNVYILLCILLATSLFGQTNYWSKTSNRNYNQSNLVERKEVPSKFDSYSLNIDDFVKSLSENKGEQIILLPNESGKYTKYTIKNSNTVSPELASKYNNILSFSGQSLDGKSTIRVDYSPYFGFTAMITSNNQNYFIDAYTKDLKNYIFYNKANVKNDRSPKCFTENFPEKKNNKKSTTKKTAKKTLGELKKYRLAITTTKEYSAYHINLADQQNATIDTKKAVVFAAVSTAINRVNSIYEKEVGVLLELIPNTDLLFFIDSGDLPNNDGERLINENINITNSIIGLNNYDIGHAFSTGAGGLAEVASVCSTKKAGGVTGLPEPINDPFYVDFVSHEIGHQFGAEHTFSSTNGGCSGNGSNYSSIEPGSGSTIMAYAGLCNPDNIQQNSFPYFSSASLDQIATFIGEEANCYTPIATNNSYPVASIKNTHYDIPHSTAILLEGEATDEDNDNLTYTWEQINPYLLNTVALSNDKNGPIFKFIPPSGDNFRYLPNLDAILQNQLIFTTRTPSFNWEVIPAVERYLDFRFTVRDNNQQVGLFNFVDLEVDVKNVGPFKITSQQTNETWNINQTITITWDVAGTNENGINTKNVKILLSKDGGKTWDYTLIESTPNNGSYTFKVPSNIGATTNARIMIRPIDNIYLAVNPVGFTISNIPVKDNDEFNDSVTFYPNPSNGEITIQTKSDEYLRGIEIYDAIGRLIYSSKFTGNNNIHNVYLNRFVDDGVYIIKLQTDKETKTKKLIIKK